MSKTTALFILTCFYCCSFFAQTEKTNRILEQISQNNPQLIAYQAYIKSQNLTNRSENNLEDPEVTAFYLPFGLHDTKDYYEYQISQRFEFPSIYGMRGEKIEQQRRLLELNYEQLRQAVLIRAQKELIDLRHLQKRKDLEQERLETAQKVHRNVEQSFQQGKINALERNKAKVIWMQMQFEQEKLSLEEDRIRKNLQQLNGGKTLETGNLELIEKREPLAQSELWEEKSQMAPALKKMKIEEELVKKQLQLQKQKWLPDIVFGYNYQGVSSSYYHGFVGGLSIPLWNNTHKVEAAKSELKHTQSENKSQMAEFKNDFQKKFQRYQFLLKKYREYSQTLSEMDSAQRLLDAFEKGELSFPDYHGELEFYQNAVDDKLEMEKELHQLRTELLGHRL